MYAVSGVLFPYMQNLCQDIQQLEEFCKNHRTNVAYSSFSSSSSSSSSSMNNLSQISTISEYDLGGEGDLFKAPQPIIEEPVVGLDPMAAAISLISCGEEAITPQALKMADIESIQSGQLLSELFYECKKDLIEKAAIEVPLSDVEIPIMMGDKNHIQDNRLLSDMPLPKSVSSGCLSSMEWMHGPSVKPSFMDLPGRDFGTVYGMRRAFSEGDIKTLGNCSTGIHSSGDQPLLISNCSSEDRREKLSRYRNKKTKRNFGRKIKYACRKALADSQPRIRGRFAKTEEIVASKRQ